MIKGIISAVRGVVVDIQFPEDHTPGIYDALFFCNYFFPCKKNCQGKPNKKAAI